MCDLDKEKIISGLKHHLSDIDYKDNGCKDCPYKDIPDKYIDCEDIRSQCDVVLLQDSISLLEDLVETTDTYRRIEELRRNREHTSNWIKYWRKKNNQNNLTYPDWDSIFEDWESRGKEIADLNAEIKQKEYSSAYPETNKFNYD